MTHHAKVKRNTYIWDSRRKARPQTIVNQGIVLVEKDRLSWPKGQGHDDTPCISQKKCIYTRLLKESQTINDSETRNSVGWKG